MTQPPNPAVTLLPCPFCGGTAYPGRTAYSRPLDDAWWADGSSILETHRINCASCGGTAGGGPVGGYQTPEKAIAAWNTRQPAPVGNETVVRVATAVMRWGQPHFKHMVAFSTLCEAIEAAVYASRQSNPVAAGVGEGLREAVRSEIINTPETADFMAGVPLEAAHQRERWGVSHDGGKTPFDWFWLIGYLAQKAASAQTAGDMAKAQHHTISTAAALANWHAQIAGRTEMRPGIGPDNGGEKPGSAFALAAALSTPPEDLHARDALLLGGDAMREKGQ